MNGGQLGGDNVDEIGGWSLKIKLIAVRLLDVNEDHRGEGEDCVQCEV